MKDRLLCVQKRVGESLLGKEQQIKLALACIIARGHLLIEDLPGVGKTLLAQALAKALGLGFSRVQFTSDLLPAEILGVSTFDRNTGAFVFHPGPIFSQVVLADEINRATPKTQSALLEAMEERQVTIEGATRPLPRPFFVMATQNPEDQAGTFPLPESQLDRFLMRLRLGYPDAEAERRLWREPDRRLALEGMEPCTGPGGVEEFQRAADGVHVSDNLLDYVRRLVDYTRNSRKYRFGLSPRGGAAVIRSARALALLDGLDYVGPEEIQGVLPYVAGHRLHLAEGEGAEADIGELIKAVPV
ncbi:MoxR family ATPase [bacterium]|nr:MAG: MoxR family ATPase [bacterium]